jgi:hypothetical protein
MTVTPPTTTTTTTTSNGDNLKNRKNAFIRVRQKCDSK